MRCEKDKAQHAQHPNQEYPQLGEATLGHHLNEERWKRKRMTTPVNSTICTLERERRGVAKGDANHNTSKRRRNMPVITMMGPLMKANLRWFQIVHPQDSGLEHHHLSAAGVNQGDPTLGKSESKYTRRMFATS
jgi:hypothetical protein